MKTTENTEMSPGQPIQSTRSQNKLSDGQGQELLEDFLMGNERAFDAIIKAYSPMMFGVFLRWFKLSIEDAQDLHQEVLLQLVVKAERIRNLRPWLLGTSINQAKKRIRKLVRDRKLSEAYIRDVELSERFDDRENRDLIERGLALASEHDRRLLRLIYFEGLTYQEAADQLGRPIGSIGPLRGRALDRFTTIIEHIEAPKASTNTVH